jgi:5-methyltetrahydropteroyltriglutamate--homocysteine methyltransferase
MLTHTLGFPRIGKKRELKLALEAFWADEISEADLRESARMVRMQNWQLQRENGIDLLPVGDFTLYDHVLDTAVMLGAVPDRYRRHDGLIDLHSYFRMARGDRDPDGVHALQMTKWFDTNYHYIVPELDSRGHYRPDCHSLVDQIDEAVAAGIRVKPVLLGPMTFLRLSRIMDESRDAMDHVESLIAAYEKILEALSDKSEWIQVDEPIVTMHMSVEERACFSSILDRLIRAAFPAKLMLATYFGSLDENIDAVCNPDLGALHIDLVSAPGQLTETINRLPSGPALSLGLVDGRNIWKVDVDTALRHIDHAAQVLGTDRVMLGTSCSLLHVPVDLSEETEIEPAISAMLAFAVQKCAELRALDSLYLGDGAPSEASSAKPKAGPCQQKAANTIDPHVRQRCEAITADMLHRNQPYAVRRPLQQAALQLPLLPTTTIGSFPQTQEMRSIRDAYKTGKTLRADYEQAMYDFIRDIVEAQLQVGVDVLVHGEPERNDMVEYFAEHLRGFCTTRHGWVQSYGSRCVKPPIIYGDVSRPEAITLGWITFAQSLTSKPLKGMLTGPVTMLQWSFVRNDIDRQDVARQVALAVRDEVQDLEAAGIRIIQVDEPALREGLPLRFCDRDAYLRWAIDAFRIATSSVRDETQIHTHMCYGDFGDIASWIVEMDADVISIEACRSGMQLLEAFLDQEYPREIGPGVWDVHSPRIPSAEEMAECIRRVLEVFPVERVWVNPDCGLKTRGWCEVIASLENMVKAATRVRGEVC